MIELRNIYVYGITVPAMLGRTPGAAATRGPRSRPRPRARTAGRLTGAGPAAPPSRCWASPWPPPPASSSGRTSCPPRSCCRSQETRIRLTAEEVTCPVGPCVSWDRRSGRPCCNSRAARKEDWPGRGRQSDRQTCSRMVNSATIAPLVDWHSDSLCPVTLVTLVTNNSSNPRKL